MTTSTKAEQRGPNERNLCLGFYVYVHSGSSWFIFVPRLLDDIWMGGIMETWYLVLMLGWARQGGMELMPVEDKAQCVSIGKQWTKQMNIIHNKGEFWLEARETYASFKCFVVKRDKHGEIK